MAIDEFPHTKGETRKHIQESKLKKEMSTRVWRTRSRWHDRGQKSHSQGSKGKMVMGRQKSEHGQKPCIAFKKRSSNSIGL